ncbi:MAG: efflux RND transporter permease subunit [Planctomycetota bacterium]|jgi:multidrug efflux pump subunit AcrB
MKSLPRFTVENPVLANLFMMSLIAGGLLSSTTIIREMFPESRPNRVRVTTTYPGASPSEVEKGITLRVEETIKDVENIEKIVSAASEGVSTIIIEMESGYDDIDQAVTDIKAAIDTIPAEDFPEESKETSVSRLEPRLPVISVAVFGNVDDRTLKDLGEEFREELLALPGISNVTLFGTRRDEISVEIRPEKLAQFGLSFMDVAETIAAGNLDLPGGQLRTPGANVAVRTLGEKDRGEDLYDLVIRSDPTGRVVRLRDVATIIDGFEDVDVLGRFNGTKAVDLTVYKTADQDAIAIAQMIRAWVAGKRQQPLALDWFARLKTSVTGNRHLETIHTNAGRNPFPPGINIEMHTDLARFVEGRLDLLTRNGLWGLVLVAFSLLIFLHWRVAFWVIMGLVLSIMGALIFMQLLGHTLNLITMFGLIIVLGLLVDDAIIVSEHVYSKVERGLDPTTAAVEGTEAVTWPVVCAILTTIVAFFPLMFIEGQLGDWMGTLPIIVCIALAVSLVEALTILPSHLAHGMRPVRVQKQRMERSSWFALVHHVREWQHNHLLTPLRAGYEKLLRLATSYRYVTIATLAAILIMSSGLIAGGFVKSMFLQKIDSETLVARVQMRVGTPRDETAEAVAKIEEEILALPELKSVYTLLGIEVSDDGIAEAPQSHLAQMFMELTESENRDRSSDMILGDLRQRTANIAGVQKLKYSSMQGGPGGMPIHLEISGDDVDEIVLASRKVQDYLKNFDGVFDIVDDFNEGRREVQIELFDSARALGLTTQSLATQVRSAFYGFEARKIQRDREDVKIMVRYPEEARRRIYDIESMRIATPGGQLVPFTEVARLKEGTGFSTIRRKDQARTVTVTADVDDEITSSRDVIASLTTRFPEILNAHPGVMLEFGGRKLENQKAMSSIYTSAMVACVMIYVILAGLFRSYIQPMIVMSVVPFGMIGVILGHAILNYPLTLLSNIGAVALTGIVVNDSMIIVTFINREVQAGKDPYEAVIIGGKSRLRPILLTSATTVLGVAPLLLEQSFQAKFLIPMGISISAGLVFATALTLVAVPALYLIVLDFKSMAARVANWFIPRSPELA